MRVRVHPADEGGCGHYRLIWPSLALEAQGHDVELSYDANYRAVWQPSAWGDRIIGLDEQVEADVVVLQRPMHRHRVELIAALQAQGVAVVVEIDDDFHAIHPSNAAWRGSNPLHNAEHNRDWLKLACERADLVTVSTPALAARYGGHGRCVVLPNYVPERYLDIGHSPSSTCPPAVGWSGSIDTHPRDLQQTEGGVAEAVLACGAIFRVVGTGKGVQRALRLHDPPEALGWMPLQDYPEGLSTFDVGIAPLQLSAFNEAKSWLKMVEMAAVGVPAVGSPTQQYRAAAGLGIGRIAESADDWWSLLTAWLRNESLRRELAQEGREAARELTIERNAYRWAEAWEQAGTGRHRTTREAVA